MELKEQLDKLEKSFRLYRMSLASILIFIFGVTGGIFGTVKFFEYKMNIVVKTQRMVLENGDVYDLIKNNNLTGTISAKLPNEIPEVVIPKNPPVTKK